MPAKERCFMKLNPEILNAIKAAIDHYGNSSQFAKEIDVAHSTVLFWLSGKTHNIRGSVWDKKVHRVLKKFLPRNERPAKIAGLHDSQQAFSRKKSGMSAGEKPIARKVPAIPFSKMIDMDITMQAPVCFVRQRCTDEVPFASVCSEFSFALILDEPELCPSLPLGSWMLIGGGGFDYAQSGDLAVGKTRNPERLFFCRYSRSAGKISLTPLNPNLPVMEWNDSENAEKIFWIFPVKEISINLELCTWNGNSLIRKNAETPN